MRERRPRRQFTSIAGTFKQCDELGSLKLFSEGRRDGLSGLVVDGNTQVMNAFPRVKHLDEKSVANAFTDDTVKSSKIFQHHEGTLVRVYFASGSWQISTQRKIDAYKSKWSERLSFGEAFAQAVALECSRSEKFRERLGVDDGAQPTMDDFCKSLDPNLKYLFIVRHWGTNRIVCDAPDEMTAYHVGTFTADSNRIDVDVDIGFTKPSTHSVQTVRELQDLVRGLDPRVDSGFMILDANDKWYKLQSREYLDLEDVRGNEPSLKFRYLQVRLDDDKVGKLYDLYPDQTHFFEDYEDTLYDIARYVHSAYIRRFVKREYVTVEREFFGVMSACHEWHKQDRKYNRVDLDKVIEVLNSRYDHVLNKMIRMFKKIKSDEEHAQDAQGATNDRRERRDDEFVVDEEL
jgi:hypothetical protein